MLIIGSAVFVMFMLVLAWAQEDMEYVDSSVFEYPQRPSAWFNHDIHNEAAEIDDCIECHHVYEDGVRLDDEDSTDSRCSDCHDLEQADDMPGLMDAYHLNCKGCHKANSAGPIMCGECHVKGSRSF
ncbi:acidic tetraheme cytochrome c3 TmcA [Thermodesulfobacteriota bacterium]